MEAIRTAAISLCAALIISAVFSILIPSAGMERFAKLTVRLFFLICLVLPLFKSAPRFAPDFSKYLAASQEVEMNLESLTQSQMVKAFEENVVSQVEAIAAQCGFFPRKTEASAHIDEGQSIQLTEIKITARSSGEEGLAETISKVEAAFQISPEVSYLPDE